MSSIFKKKCCPTITFAMIAKNEEALLPQCLDSVKDWVDEIIVVNNNSTDSTGEIAKRYNAKIINSQRKGNFSLLRNIYLKKARCDWVFSLDADERIAGKDIPEITKLTESNNSKIMGYSFTLRHYTSRYNVLLYDWFPCSGKYPNEEKFSGSSGYMDIGKYPIRLFRNDWHLSYDGYNHETLEQCILQKGGTIRNPGIPIHHFKELKMKKSQNGKSEYRDCYEIERKKNAGNYKNYYRYHFRMGRDLLFIKNDHKNACKYLERSMELKPDFVEAYFLLALVYKRRKLYQDAISVLKRALRIKKTYLGAHYLLGLIYDLRDETKLSEEEFSRALNINPYHPVVLNSLGVVLAKQKRTNQAVKCFRKAIKVQPDFRMAKRNLENTETLKKE